MKLKAIRKFINLLTSIENILNFAYDITP